MIAHIIKKLVYKERYVKTLFMPETVIKWCVKDSLNCIKYKGRAYVVSKDKDIHIFDSGCSEEVEIEKNIGKYEYYVDSSEFTTVLENKVLKTLLMMAESQYILIILILSAMTAGMCLFTYMKLTGVEEQIAFLINNIQTTPPEVYVQ